MGDNIQDIKQVLTQTYFTHVMKFLFFALLLIFLPQSSILAKAKEEDRYFYFACKRIEIPSRDIKKIRKDLKKLILKKKSSAIKKTNYFKNLSKISKCQKCQRINRIRANSVKTYSLNKVEPVKRQVKIDRFYVYKDSSDRRSSTPYFKEKTHPQNSYRSNLSQSSLSPSNIEEACADGTCTKTFSVS
jgi:hypothetical protein